LNLAKLSVSWVALGIVNARTRSALRAKGTTGRPSRAISKPLTVPETGTAEVTQAPVENPRVPVRAYWPSGLGEAAWERVSETVPGELIGAPRPVDAETGPANVPDMGAMGRPMAGEDGKEQAPPSMAMVPESRVEVEEGTRSFAVRVEVGWPASPKGAEVRARLPSASTVPETVMTWKRLGKKLQGLEKGKTRLARRKVPVTDVPELEREPRSRSCKRGVGFELGGDVDWICQLPETLRGVAVGGIEAVEPAQAESSIRRGSRARDRSRARIPRA
jgi:hypothetical protein